MNKAVIRRSELIYDFILQFYPKNYRQEFGEEMKYVFSESLKDAYNENGERGLITFWARTSIDAGKSLFIQHIENYQPKADRPLAEKGGESMKTKNKDIIMQNKVFLWIALVTGFIVLMPYLAMQFNWQVPDPGSAVSGGVNWTLSDFVVMGTLLFGTGSTFVLVARKIEKKYRLVVGIAFVVALFYIWAELAVGIFTNIGS